MRLTYLTANIRPSKQYKPNEIRAYPNIKNFTSVDDEVTNISEFYWSLIERSATGDAVLLKGNTDRALDNESRAGHTLTDAPTQWMVLDIDGLDGDIDTILTSLGLSNYSHVIQYSSSYGILLNDRPFKSGLRAHVYFMFDRDIKPVLLKEWFKYQNLNSYSDQMNLTGSGFSLTWPLDPSVADNTQLIYITPALCEAPYVDSLSSDGRIVLVNRDTDLVPVDQISEAISPHSFAIHQNKVNQLISDKRREAGLPSVKRKTKRLQNGSTILVNPDPSPLDYSHDERGYAYYNMSGGDSLAYWHPSDNSSIIYSFKPEELPFRFIDVDPVGFQTSIERVDKHKLEGEELVRGAGRDYETDTFFTYAYDPKQETLEKWNIQENRVEGHFNFHGMVPPDPIPEYVTRFDPTVDIVFDPINHWINTFSDNDLGKSYRANPVSRDITEENAAYEVSKAAPHIMSLMDHVLGNDNEVLYWTLNWLAHIVQVRTKPGTALVIHGVPGTGKNVFMEHVVRPLIGDNYYNEIRMDSLTDRFNNWMAKSRFIMINEANELSMANEGSKIGEQLKNIITESRLSLRAMRREYEPVETFFAVALASNSETPILLDSSDRRFTICPRQKSPLTTVGEYDVKRNFPALVRVWKEEIHAFAKFLYEFPIDQPLVIQSLENEARLNMIIGAKTSTDEFCDALKYGHLDYFIKSLPAEALQATFGTNILTIANSSKQVMMEYLKHLDRDYACRNDELRLLYMLVTHNTNTNPVRFGKMLAKHGIVTNESLRRDKKKFRGLAIRWALHDMTPEEAYEELQGTWKESSTVYNDTEVPDFLRKKLDS